jgi:hypothetical protein
MRELLRSLQLTVLDLSKYAAAVQVPTADAAAGQLQQQWQRLSKDLQQLAACLSDALTVLGPQPTQSEESPAILNEPTAAAAAAAANSRVQMGADSPDCYTKAARSDVRTAVQAADVVALLPGLGGRLVACGEALAALCPVLLCCNNPGCVELRGASELQLVAGKGSVCSRCRLVAAAHQDPACLHPFDMLESLFGHPAHVRQIVTITITVTCCMTLDVTLCVLKSSRGFMLILKQRLTVQRGVWWAMVACRTARYCSATPSTCHDTNNKVGSDGIDAMVT